MGTFRRMDGSLITNEIKERPNPACCSGNVLCPECASQLTTNDDEDAMDMAMGLSPMADDEPTVTVNQADFDPWMDAIQRLG